MQSNTFDRPVKSAPKTFILSTVAFHSSVISTVEETALKIQKNILETVRQLLTDDTLEDF